MMGMNEGHVRKRRIIRDIKWHRIMNKRMRHQRWLMAYCMRGEGGRRLLVDKKRTKMACTINNKIERLPYCICVVDDVLRQRSA